MATLQPKPFVRDPFAKRRKPVKDPALLAAFADSHYWCQACGRYGDCTIHHIIGLSLTTRKHDGATEWRG